jgi:hypothetical protein
MWGGKTLMVDMLTEIKKKYLNPLFIRICMKSIKRFILFTVIVITVVCCNSTKKEKLLLNMDIEKLYKCNQFYITDNYLYLLFYNPASPDSFNPFAMDPYIICYNDNCDCLDFKQINTTKIFLQKADTIYLIGQEQYVRNKKQQKRLNNKFIKFIIPPPKTRNVCNKVIESFQLDTLTMNVKVKYREYQSLTVGLCDPYFFQDSTLLYSNQDSIYKLSDFIFHSTENNQYITYIYFVSDQTINEKLLFDNTIILQTFYDNLYKYICHND